jgi:hypothetical protein
MDWANDDFASELTTIARKSRAFGDEHGICPLMHDLVRPEEGVSHTALGRKLTSAAAHVADPIGATPHSEQTTRLVWKSAQSQGSRRSIGRSAMTIRTTRSRRAHLL